jgi:predicted nucleic acid-binding protein
MLARALGDKIGLPDREVRSVLSFVCGADVLVTGDRDLLELGQPARIRIVSPRGFWQLVEGPADG